jgi:hypothetical protein
VVVRAGGYCQQCWDYNRSIPPPTPGPQSGEGELKSRRRKKRKKKKPKKGSWIRRKGTVPSSRKDKEEREGRIKGGKRRGRRKKKEKKKKMKKGGGKRQSRQWVTTGAVTRQTYANVEQQQLQQQQQQQRQLQGGTGSLAEVGEGRQESVCVEDDSQSCAGMRRCRCRATEQYPCWHQGKCSSLLSRDQDPVCSGCKDFEPEHEGESGSYAPAAGSSIEEGSTKGYASRPPGSEAHAEGTTWEDCGCTICIGRINDQENKRMTKEQAEWDRILAAEVQKTAMLRIERYGRICDHIEAQEIDKEQQRLQEKYDKEAEEDEARDNEVRWSLIEAKKRPRPAEHAKRHGQQAKPTPKTTLKAVSKVAMRNSSGRRSREDETQEAMDRRIIAEAVWYGQQEDESID